MSTTENSAAYDQLMSICPQFVELVRENITKDLVAEDFTSMAVLFPMGEIQADLESMIPKLRHSLMVDPAGHVFLTSDPQGMMIPIDDEAVALEFRHSSNPEYADTFMAIRAYLPHDEFFWDYKLDEYEAEVYDDDLMEEELDEACEKARDEERHKYENAYTDVFEAVQLRYAEKAFNDPQFIDTLLRHVMNAPSAVDIAYMCQDRDVLTQLMEGSAVTVTVDGETLTIFGKESFDRSTMNILRLFATQRQIALAQENND